MLNITVMNTDNLILDKNKDSLHENELKYLDSLSDIEIEKLINQCNIKYNYHNAVQQASKLVLNQSYGALGNPHFVCSTKDIANAITSMCRDTIKYMGHTTETYFYEYWHIDYDLHEHLGIDSDSIIPLDSSWIHRESKTDWDGEVTQQDVEEGIYQRKTDVALYIDTDSVDSKTILRTSKGIMTIEDLYKYSEKFGSNGETAAGHESVLTDAKILNYDANKGLYYANIKRVIKHKVNKPKYKLKSKTGKEVIVTSDHSLIIFRDNKQLVVKPNEIMKGDKILELKL